jgi:lipoprotein-releasing system permease protein
MPPPLRFELFVAARYLGGKNKRTFLGLITLISMAGVAVGVMTLVVAMGIMTGFGTALRDTILGNRAHVTVFEMRGAPIYDAEGLMAQLEAMPGVVAASPVLQLEALLKHGDRQTGAYVVGVDPARESRVTRLAENLSDADGRTRGAGELPGHKEIVLGCRLAERLGVGVGDDIGVLTSKQTATAYGVRRVSQVWLRVSGVAQARMSEFDTLYAYVDLATAALLGAPPGVEAVQLRLANPDDAGRMVDAIEQATPYGAQSWFDNQEAYFQALDQEKMAMFIILVFIILVAAFNITSTLIMIVMEKRRDIGILRTLGAGTRAIVLIFVSEGLLIGVGGTVLGLAAGLGLALNINPVANALANALGVDLFNAEIYYFDGIPVEIVPSDLIAVAVAAVVLSLLSALYPAWSAARLHPVDAMRHE